MRKEYYNYVVKLPVLLHELFRGKVADGNMLSIMRRHYHNTLNRELAEMLGVSERSVTRKAREMGLEKDKGFVASLSREHLLLANARSKELGYPGGFTKGMKFRGNQYTGRIRVE